MRAAALLRTGRPRDAVIAFREQPRLELRRLAAMWLALAHAESGDASAVREWLARVVSIPPESAFCHPPGPKRRSRSCGAS